MSEEYYKIKGRVSNSHLGWFQRSPSMYLRMISGDFEKKESLSLERGTLLHLAILQPEKFVVSDTEPIGGMMGKFIEALALDKDFQFILPSDISQQDVLKAYEKSGFKQGIGIVLDKFVTDSKSLEYFRYLRESQGKIAIKKEDNELIKRCKKSLILHKKAYELLFEYPYENENYNELQILWEAEGVPCKSLIDRLVIDHKNKLILNIDLKTTAKSVLDADIIKLSNRGSGDKLNSKYKFQGFMESYVTYYKYYRQQAFYEDAILWSINHEREDKDIFENYTMVSYCIAVETTGNNDCVVIEVPRQLIIAGHREYRDLLRRFSWHKENNLWDFPKEYYQGDGVLRFDI